ncbi:MAG: four helix bundle protein [Lyngbya sp. HA4199-MV5]|nr:four helix bundle protein [Lyngbya sp. HA4199-MV5]
MSYRFERLIVWQKSMGFCVKVYDKTRQFPKEEVYGLTSQIRRAVTSIPLNIAEGSACKTSKEFMQFLYSALRSQYEVVTIIKLATRLQYFDNATQQELELDIAEIGRPLQALINSLQKPPKNQ